MKTTTSKIVVFALTAVLLVGAIFGIGAMADGEAAAEHKVEILYNNLEYNETTAILYAVQVDGAAADANADLTVNFYTRNKAGEYTFDYAVTEFKIGAVNGKDVYLIASHGIAPKYMTEVIFAQVVATIDGTEYKSEMSSFSIAEYCYKRLYKDTNTTADQVALYTNLLETGTALQKVLGHNVDSTPADYYYVNAEGSDVYTATIDGTTYNFTAGIFKADSTVTLSYGSTLAAKKTADWDVKFAGDTKNYTFANNDKITVGSHIIASPFLKTVHDFEDDNALDAFTITDKSGVNETHGTDYFNFFVGTSLTNNNNKAAIFRNLYASGQTQSNVKIPVEGTEGNCYVLEYDYYWDSVVTNIEGTGTTTTGSGNMLQYNFYQNGNSSAAVRTNMLRARDAQAAKSGAGMIFSSGNGHGTDKGLNLTSYTLTEEWVRIRHEMYYDETNYWTTRIFINGVFVGEDNSYNNTVDSIDYVTFHTLNNNLDLYYDNLSFYRRDIAYEALEDEIAGTASGTGVYFKNNTYTGFRADFNTLTESANIGPSINNSHKANANGYRAEYDGGYGIFEADMTAGSYADINIPHTTPTKNADTDKYIIELDIAFCNIKTPTSAQWFMTLRGMSDGLVSDLYFQNTTDGKVTIGSNSSYVSGTRYTFNADQWYNIRFEYHNNNTGYIDIYVDGKLEYTVIGADYKEDGTKGTRTVPFFRLQGSATDEYIAYDNLYAGYVAADANGTDVAQ